MSGRPIASATGGGRVARAGRPLLSLLVCCTTPVAQDASPQRSKEEPSAKEPPAFAFGYGEGFYLRSADGRNEIALEGLFQVGLNLYQRNRGRTSEFDLRRMRPELAGRFADAFRFRVEPNFRDDGVELEEAWVGLDLARRNARLMVGRMKAPFNLEEIRSRRHIDFPRFSILNQFAPAEDHGVFLNGKTSGNGFEYGLAVYNGTGASDTTSSKDVAARVAVHPFVDEADSRLADLHLGLAATWGRQSEEVGGDSIVNAFDREVIEFATGTRLDGDRLRLGVELAWFSGPWMLQSELLWVRQEMSRGGLSDHVDFYGAYVDASWVLTGEERRGWSGVGPTSPVDPVELAGTGAWVLALRASDLVSDTALPRNGFTAAGQYTEHIRSLSVGVNWILNDHLIVRHAYVHSFYSDDVLLGGSTQDNEGALMIEWQLHF